MEEGYVRASGCIGAAAGAIGFLSAWAWAVHAGGFLGFLLGWIPAAIVAVIVGAAVAFLWPLILLGLLGLGAVIGALVWRSMHPV